MEEAAQASLAVLEQDLVLLAKHTCGCPVLVGKSAAAIQLKADYP
jgi:hypothetical protein